jgi:hypothetical protein
MTAVDVRNWHRRRRAAPDGRGAILENWMADEPNNIVHVMLRDIRAKQDEHSSQFERLSGRIDRLDKQFGEQSKIMRYTLGQATETGFRQAQQESRIDELFEKLEKLLSEKAPV